MFTGIVIAGGQSKRMGFDKAQIIYQNQSFLEHAIDLITPFTSDIIISSNRAVSNSDYTVIADEYKNIGPIGGLATCLSQIPSEYALIVPVDLPLLTPEIIQYLIDHFDPNKQINILSLDNRPQMLVGIYRKKTLPIITQHIERQDYKLRNLLKNASSKTIDGTAFARLFLNVNHPETLKKLNDKHD